LISLKKANGPRDDDEKVPSWKTSAIQHFSFVKLDGLEERQDLTQLLIRELVEEVMFPKECVDGF
jgi:hypothetical protein